MQQHSSCGRIGARFLCRAHLFVVLATLGLSLGVINSLNAQSLTWLGTFGGNESWANGVSADGSVVVGMARNTSGYRRTFRWTQSGGMQNLGTFGGTESVAWGVSADGSVVVGWAQNGIVQSHAFRWTQAGGMQNLGTLGGDYSGAYDVSADGSVVVGWAHNAGGYWRAFRWTQAGGMQDLGTLGGNESAAYGVSADGSVVVGWAHNASGQIRAYRWENGVMQNLGAFGGTESAATRVSADGSVVVGGSTNDSGGYHAFRWTASRGMEDLNQTYAALLTDGSVLLQCREMSPDGRYIVGIGWNAALSRNEAFLLDTGAAYSIKGNVVLGDFTGDITQIPVTVELRQGGNVVGTRTLSLDPGGNYAFTTYSGTYDLAFKASHWLRLVVTDVQVVNADVTGVNVSLTNGDIDGDNEVTLFDFGALVAAFGSIPGDPNWNPDADLDGDEEVTLFDFGVLVRNFGAIGDE